jgi:hypothetical protein
MELTDQVLKQDAAGRVWTPRERREAVLDEFERSGLPATKFAAHVGVKYQTFAAWVQKRRKGRQGGEGAAEQAAGAVRWMEASVGGAPSGTTRGLVIHLPGGVRLEVLDATQAVLAAQVLRALGSGGFAC